MQFEQNLVNRLPSKNIVDLSKDIELISGSCSHSSHAGHNHGYDPHIWTSPRELQIMATTTYDAIIKLYPDSVPYIPNSTTFVNAITSV